jgi:hypothetical protein
MEWYPNQHERPNVAYPQDEEFFTLRAGEKLTIDCRTPNPRPLPEELAEGYRSGRRSSSEQTVQACLALWAVQVYTGTVWVVLKSCNTFN